MLGRSVSTVHHVMSGWLDETVKPTRTESRRSQSCPAEMTSLLTLHNRVVLANRLVKAATSEHLATRFVALARQFIDVDAG